MSHQKVAEQHELAAKAHRTAAEHNEKGDYSAAIWHSERALEYADRAYEAFQGSSCQIWPDCDAVRL